MRPAAAIIGDVLRQRLIDALQALILHIDVTVLPRGIKLYQPLPWLGLSFQTKRSAEGTARRLSAIEGALRRDGPAEGVVLDVGCSLGYFSLHLAEQGYFSYGVEQDARFVRIARAAARRGNIARFTAIEATVDRHSLSWLPDADVTLCLSIWHHWVRAGGLDHATSLLRALWDKTREALFFDSGEDAMPSDYGLAFLQDDPQRWLHDYLARELPAARVESLGRFDAFAPGATQTPSDARRELYCVRRTR